MLTLPSFRGISNSLSRETEADFFVTNDSEFAAANTNATNGQIIELSDAGIFTHLTLSNATGVTVRGQTPGAPVVRRFTCSDCVGATLKDFKIQPNTIPSGAPKILGLQGNCNGLVIDNLIIRGGNPWNNFEDFDPTITDIAEMGTNGSWSTANAYADHLWYGIGNGGGTVVSGSIEIKNCLITDVGEGIKFGWLGNGSMKINGNRLGRCYQDHISFGLGDNAGPVTAIEVCGNEGWDAFAQAQDNGNPHGDFIQFYTDDVLPATYNHPVPNLLIAGNVYWYTPGCRGGTQRIFASDFYEGYPIVAPVVVDNLLISRMSSKGITMAAEDVGQSGSVWGMFYRNTLLANPSHNFPIQNELYNNPGPPDIPPSNPNSAALITVITDPTYPDAMNYVAKNICESVPLEEYSILQENVVTGRGSSATSYGSNANVSTDLGWSAVNTAEGYFAAFSTIMNDGKGVGLAGSTANQILSNWKSSSSRPWSLMPSWVGWKYKQNMPLSSVVMSDWAYVHAGGPGGQRTISISGGEYQIADDHLGLNAGNWTSASGLIANGKYLRVRLTSSSVGATTVILNVTIGSDVMLWEVTTISTAAYPTVAFDGSDRFTRTGALGSDSRYCTMGFKMKFPNTNPNASTAVFIALNSADGTSSGLQLIILPTGLIRLILCNASGTIICALNTLGSSLCDGNVHEVLMSIDVDQSSAVTGRNIWIDGVESTSATGTWLGGPGEVIGYSRTTGIAKHSIGGTGSTMLPSGTEMHYFYLNITERADISSSAIRTKFDASHIGANGSGVTGTIPHTFVTGVASQWNDVNGINWGFASGKYIKATGSTVTDVSGNTWP